MPLDVRDFGPGLDQERFDDPGSTLQRLRARLLEQGGDLQLRPPEAGGGAAVRLTLTLRAAEVSSVHVPTGRRRGVDASAHPEPGRVTRARAPASWSTGAAFEHAGTRNPSAVTP